MISSRVLDFGLSILDAEATHFYVCSQAPANFGEVVTYALGAKNFGPGACFGSPVDASPNGRKVASTAITDGLTSGSGTITHVAVTDDVNSRLLAVVELTTPVAVIAAKSFSLASFDVRLPSQ